MPNTRSQLSSDRSTWETSPATANTSTSAGSATSIATTAFTSRYAQPGSGVSRSCRFQPAARSTATRPPVLIDAEIAPNAAMLTIRLTTVVVPSGAFPAP